MSYNRKGYKPPVSKKVWKPGCICNICGTEILEKHLSKDDFKKQYEQKWGVHWACHEKLTGAMDRNSR